MLARKRTRVDSTLTKAVLKVGKGRGFIIQHRVWLPPLKMKRKVFAIEVDGKPTRVKLGPINEGRRCVDQRLVVTAAHCLPFLPPAKGVSYPEDRTYANLLGVLSAETTNVWAECRFVDPVADIAVLGRPDDQMLGEQGEAYEALVHSAPPLQVGKAPREGPAWVLSLDGKWARCIVQHFGGRLSIKNPSAPIEGGMSGSPILNDNAQAIGIVCLGDAQGSDALNPRLEHNLPGWLLHETLWNRIWDYWRK